MSNIIKVKDSNGNWIGIPALQGEPGITPHIGENGNWFIGEEDTGVKANIDLTPYATTEEVNQAINAIDIPTKVSELTNDSGFITEYTETDPLYSADKDKLALKTELPTKTSELTNDSGFLTQHQDISNLATKAELPTKISELTNDTGFITNTVSNLTNYYKKSETYTQTEVNNLINAITTLNIQVVSTLPTSNISTTTIYLKGSETTGTNDYEEWIYVNGGWELIGTTAVDLTPYATKTEVDTKIAEVTKSSLGLGNVENKSSATIRGELTSANVTNALGYTPLKTAYTLPVATSSALGGVKSGTDITVDANGNVSVNNNSHTHTVANISDLTATATELNYMDGVTSNVQTQLNNKAASSHTHNYAGSASAGGAANESLKININRSEADDNFPILLTNKGDGTTVKQDSVYAAKNNTVTLNPKNGTLTATKFVGDGASITGLKEGNLTWGNKAHAGSVSPMGMALSEEHSANKTAFINGNAITIEYSTDGGTTYTDSGISASNKSALFTKSYTVQVGGSTAMTTDNYTKLKTRITLTGQDGTNGYLYTDIKKILINANTASTLSMLVETMHGNSTSWVTYGTYQIKGWSGWNDVPIITTLGGGASQKDRPWKLRFTFSLTACNTSYSTTKGIQSFRVFGQNSWTVPATLGQTGHMYTYDMDKNVAFPKKVTATTFSGSGAELTALNASNISSGTVPAARLPKASTSAVGGIKVGSGLSIDANGVLSAANGSGATSLSLSVATSAWSADTTYTGYGFKATVTATGVTANSILLVGLTNTATSAQEEASAAAGVQCKGQAANQIILYAKTKPTIALPISVTILG